jgi:hypothetical protein
MQKLLLVGCIVASFLAFALPATANTTVSVSIDLRGAGSSRL